MKTIDITVPAGAKILIDGKEYKPESKVWSPVDDEIYYYTSVEGNAFSSYYNMPEVDDARVNQGRVFETEAEAELFSERERLVAAYTRRIAEINAEQGWEIDLEDGRQAKYYCASCSCSGESDINRTYLIIQQHKSMYGSKKTIETVENEFSDDLKLIIIGER